MPERKDAVDASNKESKIESGRDQNLTKDRDAHQDGGPVPGSDQEPKNPIPYPKDGDKT